MANFGRIVDKVIDNSDIVLLVIDARMPELTLNKMLDSKLKKLKKKFIYVVNKCDLITNEEMKRINLPNSVKISAIKRDHTKDLRKMINKIGGGEKVIVGVVGYPNTGKSTIINALKGKKSAKTSSVSGYTRGMQKLKVSDTIMMLDTPGVFSYANKKVDAVLIGAIDVDKIKDPENAAAELIGQLNGKVERYFKVSKRRDCVKTLEEIAIKKNILKKGGVPDTERMGKDIIRKVHKGEIR